MAGILILFIFICLLIALMIMPIRVRINTDDEGFSRGKPGLLELTIDLDGEHFIALIFCIFFVRFAWYPLQKSIAPSSNIKTPKKKRGVDLFTWNRLQFLIRVTWQSIKQSRVRKLYLDMDTSNVIINANLFPVFELMSERPQIDLNINYSGNFDLSLDMQNNLWNIMRIVTWNLLKRTFIFIKNKYDGIQS